MNLYPTVNGGEIFRNQTNQRMDVVVGVLNTTGSSVTVSPGGPATVTVEPGDVRFALFTVEGASAVSVLGAQPHTPPRLQVGVTVIGRH